MVGVPAFIFGPENEVSCEDSWIDELKPTWVLAGSVELPLWPANLIYVRGK